MSYSVYRRPLGQTAPASPSASAEERRGLPSAVTAVLLIGTVIFALNKYVEETEQPAYEED